MNGGILTNAKNKSCETRLSCNSVVTKVPFKTPADIKLLHQNMQCLRNKTLEAELLLAEVDPDIVCFTEIGLSEDEFEMVNLGGFSALSCSTRENYAHGGVGFFVRDTLRGREIPQIKSFGTESHFEATAVTIGSKKDYNELCYLGIYRSPNGSVDIFLEKLPLMLSYLFSRFSNVLVCGDINLDLLSDGMKNKIYTDIMQSFGLRSLINTATRVCRTASTLIDHVYTTLAEDVCSAIVLSTAVSDHDTQLCTVKGFSAKADDSQPIFEFRRTFHPIKIEKFTGAIVNEDWEAVFHAHGVNEKMQAFKEIFMSYFELYFPLKYQRVNTPRKLNWVTKGILKSRETLAALSQLARLSNNPSLQDRFRSYRAVYRKVLIAAKKLTVNNLIKNSDCTSKRMWDIINLEKGEVRKKKGLTEVKVEGAVISQSAEIAEALNVHFSSLVDKLRLDRVASHMTAVEANSLGCRSLFLDPVTVHEIEEILSSFKNKFSAGEDGIPDRLLKVCAGALALPLENIINESFSTGVFPECLKTARVVPVHKRGERDIKNFRPISVINGLSKVFEIAVYRRLMSFSIQTQAISPNQYGFMKGKSTTQAIAALLDRVFRAWEDKSYALSVFMDLAKAFDSIEHGILLGKLDTLGVRGVALDWFCSYLGGRSQFVDVDRSRSRPQLVRYGVPQGSVLGPLLFNIFINSLIDTPMQGNLVLYADDSTLVVRGASAEDLKCSSYTDLTYLAEWLHENRLHINVDKSKYVLFRTKNKPDIDLDVVLDNDELGRVPSIRLLGMLVDESLCWDEHVDHLCKKLNSALHLLRKLSYFCHTEVLLTVYYSLFLSHARYCLPVWGGGSSFNMNRVFLLQKQAVRVISGLLFNESCKTVFTRLGLLTLPSLYIFEFIKFVIQSGSGNSVAKVTGRATRQVADFYVPTCRLEKSKSNVNYAGLHLFNCLPGVLKAKRGERDFFPLLKSYLIAQECYSVGEFTD